MTTLEDATRRSPTAYRVFNKLYERNRPVPYKTLIALAADDDEHERVDKSLDVLVRFGRARRTESWLWGTRYELVGRACQNRQMSLVLLGPLYETPTEQDVVSR